jgi:hypothetical protein
MERRKERSGAHLEGALCDLLDPPGNPETMVGAEPKRLQDQQIEGAAEEVGSPSQDYLLSSFGMTSLLL